MVLVYSDRASQGNSPDIDSLNRLIESEFHTREPGGVKTPVCDRCVRGAACQWSTHAHNGDAGTWSRGGIGVT